MITFLAYVALVVVIGYGGYRAIARIARGGRVNELIAHRYKVRRWRSSLYYSIWIEYSIDGGDSWYSLHEGTGSYTTVRMADLAARRLIRDHRRHLDKSNPDGWVLISCNGRVYSGV